MRAMLTVGGRVARPPYARNASKFEHATLARRARGSPRLAKSWWFETETKLRRCSAEEQRQRQRAWRQRALWKLQLTGAPEVTEFAGRGRGK